MSRLLLDTTFLVDAGRSSSGGDAFDDDDDVAIAAITVAELSVGVMLARGRQRVAREAFVQDVIEAIPVVYFDLDVAAAHATLLAHVRRSGSPRGAHDLVIAATALATGRTVLSADQAAFAELPGVDVRDHR